MPPTNAPIIEMTMRVLISWSVLILVIAGTVMFRTMATAMAAIAPLAIPVIVPKTTPLATPPSFSPAINSAINAAILPRIAPTAPTMIDASVVLLKIPRTAAID